MTASDVATKAKTRLEISGTDFDTELEGFAGEVVNNLYPVLQEELPPDTSATLTAETTEVSLPAGIEEVRFLEIYDSGVSGYLKFDDYYHHGGSIHFNTSFSTDKDLKIYGLGRYALADIPAEFELVIVYWTMGEFFKMLVGNKRKYNIYSQSTGVRGTDNMRELADYYLDQGNQMLMDRVQLRGY